MANAYPKDKRREEPLPFRWVTNPKLIYPATQFGTANYRPSKFRAPLPTCADPPSNDMPISRALSDRRSPAEPDRNR